MIRKMRMIPALAILTVAIPVLAAEPTQVQPEAETGDTVAAEDVAQPDFSGHWILNAKASDNPAQHMQQARPEGAGRGGGGKAGGGMGRGMGGGRSGGGRSDGDQGQSGSGPSVEMQQRLARMQKEHSQLTIFHAGPELNITDGLEISRLMYTDGRETAIWTPQGEATATAGRHGDALTVRVMAHQGGPERVRHYTLSGDGTQLTIIEEIANPQQQEPVRIKRIYDRAP